MLLFRFIKVLRKEGTVPILVIYGGDFYVKKWPYLTKNVPRYMTKMVTVPFFYPVTQNFYKSKN